MAKYKDLSDADKKTIIQNLYELQQKSFKDIADQLGTYANKVRRDAIKYKINIRDKSEAQKNALSTGKHKHPTKGIKRSDATKQKIGNSVLESWSNMDQITLESRKKKAKENWENLTDDEKLLIQQKANQAVRVASKTGSKLEKFLLNELINNGHKVTFHEEHVLSNTKLQIDLMIPSLNLAIEIDGPSHFAPIWGSDTLNKNIKYDQKKEGLIIGKGLRLIRIKQTKDYSKSRALLVYDKLKDVIDKISNNILTDKIITIDDL
jgi:very-short-patch-repair endonuclease